MKYFFLKLWLRSVDTILDSLVKKIGKLDSLVEIELAKADEHEAAAQKLLNDADAKRAHAGRASRVAEKIKALVS